MLDIISKFFLAFSNTPVLLAIIISGLALRPKFFVTPIFLLLFTMIFSAVLKLVFAVPYSPELVAKLGKDGFSFPSGHMQSSVVFYGWLLLHCKNKWLKIALIFLLCGIAFGLIFEGYHNIFDVVGGLFFAAATIFAYQKLEFYFRKKIQK